MGEYAEKRERNNWGTALISSQMSPIVSFEREKYRSRGARPTYSLGYWMTESGVGLEMG